MYGGILYISSDTYIYIHIHVNLQAQMGVQTIVTACLCLFFPMGSHGDTSTAHEAVRICMLLITTAGRFPGTVFTKVLPNSFGVSQLSISGTLWRYTLFDAPYSSPRYAMGKTPVNCIVLNGHEFEQNQWHLRSA